MKIKDVIKLLVSLLVISGIIYYLYARDYFATFDQMRWVDWLVLTGLTLLLYFLSGLQMAFMVNFISKRRLSMADVLFMPMSMGLFSYFIPTNGGFFYAVYYLKKKYDVASTEGFSIGVVSIYISFIIAGIALLATSLALGIIHVYLIVLSLLMILSPFLIYLLNLLIQKIPMKATSLAGRTKAYLDRVITQSNTLMLQKRVLLFNLLITVATLLIFFLLYYYLNAALNLQMTLLSIIAIIAMMRISGLIRILPGNLGLEELFTAGIFGIIGKDPSIGLVFSVSLRLCAFMIMIPGGVLHTAFNTEYFSFKDVKGLWRKPKPSGYE